MTSLVLIGVVLAFAAAFLESTVDVLRKRQSAGVDAVVAAWSLNAPTALVLALPLIALVAMDVTVLGNAPSVPRSSEFWMSVAASLVPNAIATYLLMSALRSADLSLTMPLMTLSAPLLLITGYLINHETPSAIGIIGILVTTAGMYVLKYDGSGGWLAPFTRLVRDKASLKMLGVAFLYALSSPWDKRASMAGGALWYAWAISTALALTFTPVMFFGGRWKRLWETPDARGALLAFGLLSSLRAVCQFTSVQFLLIAYAIGLKRFSVIFDVLWGRLLFGEKHTVQRAIATAVMVAGSSLVIIGASLQ